MTMPKRSRLRRILKWLGMGACTLILAGWAISGWWFFAYHGWEGNEYSIFSLHEGIFMLRAGAPEGEQEALRVVTAQAMGKNGSRTFAQRQNGLLLSHLLPRFRTFRAQLELGGTVVVNKEEILIIPLWMPFAVIALPTGFLFWRDRRRIPPGHCQRCGYNLTGNVSGKCSECGEPCESVPVKREKSKVLIRHRNTSRCSFLWSFSVGALVFMFLIIASMLLLDWVMPMLNEALDYKTKSTVNLPVAMLVYFSLLLFSALAGEHVYSRMRWKPIRTDFPQCLTCNYNLTGNVSGICPECGEPCDPDASAT